MRLQPHIGTIHTHLCTLGRILDWFKHANLIIKIASINASGISLDQSEVEPGSVERLRAVNHRSFIRVAIEMLLGVVSGLRDRIAGGKKMFCLLSYIDKKRENCTMLFISQILIHEGPAIRHEHARLNEWRTPNLALGQHRKGACWESSYLRNAKQNIKLKSNLY
jgi:hypothetical protein